MWPALSCLSINGSWKKVNLDKHIHIASIIIYITLVYIQRELWMKTNNVDAMINTCVEYGKPFYYLLCLLDILNSK